MPDPRHKNRSGLSLCVSRSCFRGQDFSFVLVALTSNQFLIQTQAQVKLCWPASDGPALPHAVMNLWTRSVCVNCCNHGSDGDAKPIIFQSMVKRPSLICVCDAFNCTMTPSSERTTTQRAASSFISESDFILCLMKPELQPDSRPDKIKKWRSSCSLSRCVWQALSLKVSKSFCPSFPYVIPTCLIYPQKKTFWEMFFCCCLMTVNGLWCCLIPNVPQNIFCVQV